MNLSDIRKPVGSNTKRKRVGRGMGSGMGKTSTRGHKGQGSRSGSSLMRGFVNIFKKEYEVVNLSRLEELGEAEITPEVLYKRGVISKRKALVKVLGNGELTTALTVAAHKFSASAQEKIAKAGGSTSLISLAPQAAESK